MEGIKHRFVIYRILGNDLPPRHEVGQTFRNLCFMLDHEPEFAHCVKRWIVNRIVDPWEEERLLELLERRNQEYLRVPFLIEEYRACIANRVSDDYPRQAEVEQESDRQRHNKVLYAMNNNGARNLALRTGRKLAKWILPLDGNCCFDQEGWNRLEAKIDAQTTLDACLVIPMYRLTNNAQYFSFNRMEREEHEPQVILGSESTLEFNEMYRYGNFSKMELLKKLNVPYRCTYSMEILDEECKCGYVLRLFSGVAEGEGNWKVRGPLRREGINAMLNKLDAIAGLVAANGNHGGPHENAATVILNTTLPNTNFHAEKQGE